MTTTSKALLTISAVVASVLFVIAKGLTDYATPLWFYGARAILAVGIVIIVGSIAVFVWDLVADLFFGDDDAKVATVTHINAYLDQLRIEVIGLRSGITHGDDVLDPLIGLANTLRLGSFDARTWPARRRLASEIADLVARHVEHGDVGDAVESDGLAADIETDVLAAPVLHRIVSFSPRESRLDVLRGNW